MPCSRYFRDDELPACVIVKEETPREFYAMIYGTFSKAGKATVDARPNIQTTKIWFVAHAMRDPWLTVRSQTLLRDTSEQYWGANDCNPPWTRKVKETPWFATEEEAKAHLALFLADGHDKEYEHPFMWWMRENKDRSEQPIRRRLDDED